VLDVIGKLRAAGWAVLPPPLHVAPKTALRAAKQSDKDGFSALTKRLIGALIMSGVNPPKARGLLQERFGVTRQSVHLWIRNGMCQGRKEEIEATMLRWIDELTFGGGK